MAWSTWTEAGGTLTRVELLPFSEVVWKPRGLSLRARLPELTSACSRAEVLTVVHGLRPVATVHLSSAGFDQELARYVELGLWVLPLRRFKPMSGMAHRFYDPEPGGPFGVYTVVARDRELLYEFRSAHEASDHERIGELLGYPPCCRRFFREVWPTDVDPILPMALASGARSEGGELVVEDYYPEVLPVVRYFGLRVVPHLPCSFRCEESRKFAQLFLNFLPEEVLELLAQPILFSSLNGVALVDTPLFLGVANTSYQPREVRIRFPGVSRSHAPR